MAEFKDLVEKARTLGGDEFANELISVKNVMNANERNYRETAENSKTELQQIQEQMQQQSTDFASFKQEILQGMPSLQKQVQDPNSLTVAQLQNELTQVSTDLQTFKQERDEALQSAKNQKKQSLIRENLSKLNVMPSSIADCTEVLSARLDFSETNDLVATSGENKGAKAQDYISGYLQDKQYLIQNRTPVGTGTKASQDGGSNIPHSFEECKTNLEKIQFLERQEKGV